MEMDAAEQNVSQGTHWKQQLIAAILDALAVTDSDFRQWVTSENCVTFIEVSLCLMCKYHYKKWDCPPLLHHSSSGWQISFMLACVMYVI